MYDSSSISNDVTALDGWLVRLRHKVESLQELFALKVNSANVRHPFRIQIRLNPEEEKSKELSGSVGSVDLVSGSIDKLLLSRNLDTGSWRSSVKFPPLFIRVD
ncbi:hypothetical protein IFM47457_08584 [Aspergillus lentulus]|nr:hypothetical protein IFM47457_08584 [Aspergillus lentulus]